ncbi:dTDP-4-dehydrorhamnose 3,5-epimerase [Neotabrizicola sp. VNH66]|uniref:dTDP-4-dehydrorhamnose 3,5-epimerase n=1 Tax=Neotabrizicola sp. VNH66 TaxID=3400918 RepID=UPI003C086066
MKIEATDLAEVKIITQRRFGDDRGWFTETWNAERMAGAGVVIDWVQDNHSFSAAKGTLRGLHYQRPPHAQDKLIRCSRGAILDVAVDFRTGSPSFGKWVAVELSAENGAQVLVPKGFLHGFLTLTADTEVQYKCSDFYAPDCDGAVRWDDPEIGVDWAGLGGLSGAPVLSDKDKVAPFLRDAPRPFVFGGMA